MRRRPRGKRYYSLGFRVRKISSNPSFIPSQLYISLKSELLPNYMEGEQQWDVIIYQIMQIFIYNGGCWFMCSSRLWILERPYFFCIPETSVYKLGFVLAALWQRPIQSLTYKILFTHVKESEVGSLGLLRCKSLGLFWFLLSFLSFLWFCMAAGAPWISSLSQGAENMKDRGRLDLVKISL